jgi:hypothetical protein
LNPVALGEQTSGHPLRSNECTNRAAERRKAKLVEITLKWRYEVEAGKSAGRGHVRVFYRL